ncbi:class I SAM-dependent methyltransferase [Nanoarchaeota archaeon]
MEDDIHTVDRGAVKPYSGKYQQVLSMERDGARPYYTQDVLADFLDRDSVLIDVGMGQGERTIPLSLRCREFFGVEPSEELLQVAERYKRTYGAMNARFVKGVAEKLPFPDGYADVVSSFLAPHDAREAYRVLRSGGQYLVEKIGEKDKQNLKAFFGSDERGFLRGYLSEMPEGQRMRNVETELRSAGFRDLRGMSCFFDCYYPTIDAFVALLEGVPHTVRDFSREKDARALQLIEEAGMTERGIWCRKHEFVLIGKKPS